MESTPLSKAFDVVPTAAAWTKGWTLTRDKAAPVSQPYGYKIDLGVPERLERHVMVDYDAGILQALTNSLRTPGTWLKVCAQPEQVSPLLHESWQVQAPEYLMAVALDNAAAVARSPQRRRCHVRPDHHRTHASTKRAGSRHHDGTCQHVHRPQGKRGCTGRHGTGPGALSGDRVDAGLTDHCGGYCLILRVLNASLFLLLIVGQRFAQASEPSPLLIDYSHTAWSEKDGAPTGVTKFAQGPDGWLWIATPTGMYRFDGVRFERTEKIHGRPLESSNIMGLTTAPDGAVWVAMRDGVAVLPRGANRFQYLGPEAGLPALGVFQILFARDGTTWIGTNTGAFFRRPGETRFTQAWPHVALVWLCETPDGTIWGNDFKNGYYRVRSTQPSASASLKPELDGYGMLFDRQRPVGLLILGQRRVQTR